jgi:hypothetical protein
MKNLSKEQKLDILSNLYWDHNISAEEIYSYLYEKKRDGHPFIDEANLYRRILTTLDWYTILKLMPPEKLQFLLHEKVIQQIFPKDLQKKYQYVRSIKKL